MEKETNFDSKGCAALSGRQPKINLHFFQSKKVPLHSFYIMKGFMDLSCLLQHRSDKF